jgi:two-component system chemotaxis response regulator CheY
MSNGRHIVIVDDDIVSLDIISYLFEERGYVVHRSADGASAIESVKELKPDLLLIDLMMPNINGATAVREIRARVNSSLPIIAFTAVDDPAIHQEALAAGCNLVLTKPCPTDKLMGAVKKFLQN